MGFLRSTEGLRWIPWLALVGEGAGRGLGSGSMDENGAGDMGGSWKEVWTESDIRRGASAAARKSPDRLGRSRSMDDIFLRGLSGDGSNVGEKAEAWEVLSG